MNMRAIFWAALGMMLAVLLCSAPAQAQAVRTWVSGVGDDVNPCSRTAPCKTFAGAMSKTAAGGSISVLDPGAYGLLTINKALSIVGDGSEAAVLTTTGNAIIVNAGGSDTVSIRGLTIEGAGLSSNGITVIGCGSLYITKTIVRGFTANAGRGIDIRATLNNVRVYLRDVEVTNNLVGVSVLSQGSALNTAFIERSTLESNSTNSLLVSGANASATISGSYLPTASISIANGGQVLSNGNNSIAGATNPTSTVPLK